MDIQNLRSIATEIVIATSRIMDDVAVVIIDQNGNYMASDDTYVVKKGTKEWKPYIDKLIEKKEVTVIDNPGENPLCKGCENEFNCPQTLEISVPFNFDNKFFGYISIVTLSQRTKEYYMSRLDQTIHYLKSMVKLMISSAKEQANRKHVEQLFYEREVIINCMEHGIVDCTVNGIIKCANKAFYSFVNKKVAIEEVKITDIIQSNIIDESLKEGVEISGCEGQVYIDGEMHRMIVNAVPVKGSSNENIGYVFSFYKAKDIRDMVMGGSENIEQTIDNIVGKSQSIIQLKDRISSIANSSSSVLIMGETGTGKELVARAIHSMSDRRDKPIVTINCAAIPDNLLESELFGYEEGAFTGGRKGGKPGLIEIANEGTLFLDEIGDMPLHLQAKLLRVLQEKEIVRIGGHMPTSVDVRVISATHQNLEKLISDRLFRMDLYYRLNIIPIRIQPLREHLSDIYELVDFFIKKYNHKLGKNIRGYTNEYIQAMKQYNWPGNVRELENAIEYSINVEKKNVLTMDSMLGKIMNFSCETKDGSTLKKRLASYERRIIQEVIDQYRGEENSIEKAASVLGISRASLYRKIKR